MRRRAGVSRPLFTPQWNIEVRIFTTSTLRISFSADSLHHQQPEILKQQPAPPVCSAAPAPCATAPQVRNAKRPAEGTEQTTASGRHAQHCSGTQPGGASTTGSNEERVSFRQFLRLCKPNLRPLHRNFKRVGVRSPTDFLRMARLEDQYRESLFRGRMNLTELETAEVKMVMDQIR